MDRALPDVPDAALLARARRGDDVALRALVVRYEPVVAATVLGMLGRGADADDVGQATFVRLYHALDRFRGESSLKTYLVRIAINLSLNALRVRLDGVSAPASVVQPVEPVELPARHPLRRVPQEPVPHPPPHRTA